MQPSHECSEDKLCHVVCRTMTEMMAGSMVSETECEPSEHVLVERCYGMHCMWCPYKVMQF